MKTSGRFAVVRGTSDGVFSIARGKKGILQIVVFMGRLVLPKILSENRIANDIKEISFLRNLLYFHRCSKYYCGNIT